MSSLALRHGLGRRLAALALCAAAHLAHAAYEPLILDLSVNQKARGEFTVVRDEEGEVFLPLADLQALGLAAGAPAGATVEIGGVPHVPLRSLAPQGLRFDEKRLALEFTLAPELLLKRTFDLAPRRPGAPAEPGGEPSAFLNYRMIAVADNGGAPL